MVNSIDSIRKSVDIDHTGRFTQKKLVDGRYLPSKKNRSTVDIDRQICKKTKKDQWPMVPIVVNNGPGQSSTKKSMVPQVVRNGPNAYTNIDTNPPINRPVGLPRSISTVGSIPPTGEHGRYRRSIRLKFSTGVIGWINHKIISINYRRLTIDRNSP